MLLLVGASTLTFGFAQSAAAQSGGNQVVNGSFEGDNGLSGWTIGGTASDGYLPVAITYNQISNYPTGAQGEAVPTDNAISLSPDSAGSKGVYFVSDHATNLSVYQKVYLTPGNYSIGFDTYNTFNGSVQQYDASFTAQIAGVQLANYNLSSVAPGIWQTHSGVATITVAGYYLVSFVFNTTTFPAKDVLIDRAYLIGSTAGGGIVIPFAMRNYWDGDRTGNANNGVVDGGNGTWTAVSTNFTDAAGASNGVLSPQPGTVVFAGTPGTVTVDNGAGAVAVTGLSFTVDGYHIAGAPLTLSGGTATVSVGNGTATGATYVATIDAQLTGSAGLTKTDLGTLVLTHANDYAGGTVVSAGTLVGTATSFGSGAITDNAVLMVAQEGTGTLDNALGGSGTFVKAGSGTLRLTGSGSFSGTTQVAQGTLELDGSLAASSITVQSGAVLSGTGSAGTISALSGSVIAPGLGIGTLGVTGTYTQAAGSTYAVDVTSTGSSDKLAIAGAATLAPGAALVVTKNDAAPYVLGRRYTILTAARGVTGTFAVSGDTKVSRFIDLVASYDPTNVYLLVAQTSSFASAGVTANQIMAARGADSGSGPLYTAVAYLPTIEQARAAFDALSGEIHASLRGISFEDSRFIREAMIDRLLDRSGSGRPLWGRGFGSWASLDSDGNAGALKRNIGGAIAGFDVNRTANTIVGVAAGYSNAQISLPVRASRASTNDVMVGGYAGFTAGRLTTQFGVGYMGRSVRTNRTVSFAGFSDAPAAKYSISVAQLFGEAGYRLGRIGAKLAIEPFAGLVYVRVANDSVVEQGGTAALSLPGETDQFLQTKAGVRSSSTIELGHSALLLGASAAWRHVATGALNTPTNVTFVSGGAFLVDGLPLARDAALVEGKIGARINQATTIDVAYSGALATHLQDNGVKATLRVTF